MHVASDAVVLACGAARWPGPAPGAPPVTRVASPPAGKDLGELLAGLHGRRLVICGTDADLAAVLLRLLRTDRLGAVALGYVPSSASSPVARLHGLPPTPAVAASIALHAVPRPVPLIRDDAGGLLAGLGVVAPVQGVAYCDNDLVLRGRAARLEVAPDPEHGLVVRVLRRGLLGGHRTVRPAAGRAVQLGCAPTGVWRDGIAGRTPDRWTWYRHTQDWLLAH